MCGDRGQTHELSSVHASQGGARIRIGCGLVDAPLPRLARVATEPSPAIGRDADSVRGRVVATSGLGLPGQWVEIGGETVISGLDGGFVFRHVPRVYNVKISDRRGGKATAYLGLTRRDPVLAHTAGANFAASVHHASVAGVLSAYASSPIRDGKVEAVRFLSPRAQGYGLGQGRVNAEGSGYRANIRWNGEATVGGLLVALVSGESKDGPQAIAYLASAPLLLKDGDAVGMDLRIRPIAKGHMRTRTLFLIDDASLCVAKPVR